MKNVAILSYILFFCFISLFNYREKVIGRNLASLETSCEQLIKPLLERYKVTHEFIEVFEKGYLSKDEVSVFKESDLARKAVESYTRDFDEQNYAFAAMALLKKRYHYLDIESTVVHYKSLFRKCPS